MRRRAALAIGHVGLAEGVPPLIEALADTDAEVRQMAAFALGLLGDKRAVDPLIALLEDPAAIVQGSAAEALGLIGEPDGGSSHSDASSRGLCSPPHSRRFPATMTTCVAIRPRQRAASRSTRWSG